MLVCRETDSLGCVNCVEKGWNKMENKVTVVLADANEEFRTMLRQRMEGTGEFHVAGSTENGDQALDLVRRLRPQLLVTDVVLPGLDGFGLLRQLNHEDAAFCAGTERRLSGLLGGDCSAPVGCYAKLHGDDFTLYGFSGIDGTPRSGKVQGKREDAEALVQALAAQLSKKVSI